MKRVIYTCLFGDIDNLPIAPIHLNDVDTICFTDKLDREDKGWQLRPIPSFNETDPIRLSRYAKILPHKVLSEYDISLYIDCNVRLKRDVSNLFECDDLWIAPKHPERECIFFEESRKIFEYNKVVNKNQLMDQLRRYKLAGMPNYFGLTENNFIIRKHNEKNVIEFCEAWWQEYLEGSPRDQISFPYVAWKKNFAYSKLDRNYCDKTFYKILHNNEPPHTKIQPVKCKPLKSLSNKIKLDNLRIGIITFRDKSNENTGSSLLRGDWLIKHWPQAELFKPGNTYDVLIFQKVYWAYVAKQFKGIKIYDCCDTFSNCSKMHQYCDISTASSLALANDLDNTHFIPDRFDLDYFKIKKVHNGRPREAVCFGYFHNKDNITPFLEPLKKLGIKLKIISEKPVDLGDINLSFPNNSCDPDYTALNYELIQSDIVLNPHLHRYQSDNKTHHAWLLNLPVVKTPEELSKFLDPSNRNIKIEQSKYDIRQTVSELKHLLENYIEKENITGFKLLGTRLHTFILITLPIFFKHIFINVLSILKKKLFK